MGSVDRIAAPLRLSPEAAAIARREAWDRYAAIPHADLNVGRAQYRAAIASIDDLESEWFPPSFDRIGGRHV